MHNLSQIMPRRQGNWLPGWAKITIAAAAIVTGFALARLPLIWAGISLFAGSLIALTLINPLVGLGAALILGPSKPLTDYFVPALPLDLGQIALLITLGSWFLHAVRNRRPIPSSPITVPLLIFIGAASLSLLNALSIGYAAKELLKWVQMLLVTWLVVDLAGVHHWRVVVGLILGAAVVQALIGAWQFGLRGDGPEHFMILDRFYRAYGTFEQPNPYGGFIGLILPLSLGLTLGALERWIAPVISAWRASKAQRLQKLTASVINHHLGTLVGLTIISGLLFMALMMSWSRGAWLGFGAASLVILFSWPRKIWLGTTLILGALVIGTAALQFNLLPGAISSRLTGFSEFVNTFDVRGVDITPANYAVLERLAHWQAGEEMARYNPWIGVGFGNYEPVYPAYRLLNWPDPLGHAHNIYLNTLAETGMIGLAAYLGLWAIIFWQTWSLIRKAESWHRSMAVGLIGVWTHLSVHNFLDKLYVANLHLHVGALLGILSILILSNGGLSSIDGES